MRKQFSRGGGLNSGQEHLNGLNLPLRTVNNLRKKREEIIAAILPVIDGDSEQHSPHIGKHDRPMLFAIAATRASFGANSCFSLQARLMTYCVCQVTYTVGQTCQVFLLAA